MSSGRVLALVRPSRTVAIMAMGRPPHVYALRTRTPSLSMCGDDRRRAERWPLACPGRKWEVLRVPGADPLQVDGSATGSTPTVAGGPKRGGDARRSAHPCRVTRGLITGLAVTLSALTRG